MFQAPQDVKVARLQSLIVTCRAGFFRPLRGCECFSQNLHLFVEVFFDIVEPEISF